MFFWNRLTKNNIALVDGEKTYTYFQLNEKVNLFQKAFDRDKKKLSFVVVKGNASVFSICAYLANLKNNNAVCLLSTWSNVLNVYKPSFVFSEVKLDLPDYTEKELDGGFIYEKDIDIEIHEDLGLLLTTSGTTGNPKLVRISYSALDANARSISEYLSINDQEKAITTLPISYSYGLSVLNSHLLSGACIVLNNYSVIVKEFWDIVKKNECTSIAGVPYTYQMFKRIGYCFPDCIKTLTQAGGKLSNELISEVVEKGRRFFVMYGQTEATARISYVPADRLKNKIGSIGVAIPKGKLYIENDELIYTGPNVMMGYAEKIEDLALGDIQNSILHTGDLAYQDLDGFFYITGRLKRFIKLFGLRINLDDIENYLISKLNVHIVACGADDKLVIVVEKDVSERLPKAEDVSGLLKDKFRIMVNRVVFVDDIEKLENGKIDYKTISEKYVQ